MDERSQKLFDLLDKNGQPELAKDFYFNYGDEGYDKFIAINAEKLKGVKGFVPEGEPDLKDVPNALTEEQQKSYFFRNPKLIDLYKNYQEKRDAEMAKKMKLAEEYKRGEDWSVNVPSTIPVIGGMDLANKYAKKHASRGETGQAVVNEIAGKTAGVLDFIPVFGLGAPAIRTMQKWAADEPVATAETGVDWGLGALGLLKKIPYVRTFAEKIAGKVGGAVENVVGEGEGKNVVKETLKGKGKVVKDFMDNPIAFGTAKQAEQAAATVDIPTEKDYTVAIDWIINRFSKDWDKNMNVPPADANPIILEAYKKYLEKKMN